MKHWRPVFWPCLLVMLCLSCMTSAADLIIAEELIVSLDAGHETAGDELWENLAPEYDDMDFQRIGEPQVVEIAGAEAVLFNSTEIQDAYQAVVMPPIGIVELDSTRSIEVWVYNEDFPAEETILSWGSRGGPNGTNISFNYGSDQLWGAVGHWGGDGPDLGWSNEGGAPPAHMWHHLVYTFDGTTTRVYCDGVEWNFEEVGPGIIDSNDNYPIVLAAQNNADGSLDVGLRGTLAIGRVRIHDGVLSMDDIINNYELERPEFPVLNEILFVNAPEEDSYIKALGQEVTYTRTIEIRGYPEPLAVDVVAPQGADITQESPTVFRLTYEIPAAANDFTVTLEASNDADDTVQASWEVIAEDPPVLEGLEIAGELFVFLDANHASAGTSSWLNYGTLGNFEMFGEPFLSTINGADAVSFNLGISQTDAYRCVDNAPEGLVGVDPTRTIEVWAHNPILEKGEETLVAWGHRGGPDGTNMSFGYGTDYRWGAVGHWGGDGPDLGWSDAGGAPMQDQWHYLVYTFDGTTTRVYADGLLANSETLNPGTINTFADTPIVIGTQVATDGVSLDFGAGLIGTLSIGKVRVHDEVLDQEQVQNNFMAEVDEYGITNQAPVILEFPFDGDQFIEGDETYSVRLAFSGIPQPQFEVLSPATGAAISAEGIFTYNIPDPAPASFTVEIRAYNDAGEDTVGWDVTRLSGENIPFGPIHRYSFTEDVTDSVGGADGVLVGDTAAFMDGQLVLTNDMGQTSADPALGSYVDLPNGLISNLGNESTFEFWVSWQGGPVWQRILDFGTSADGEDFSAANSGTVSYLFMTPQSGDNVLRYGYNNAIDGIQNERNLNTTPLPPDGSEHHVVVTWNENATTARMYVDGRLAAEDLLTHMLLADLVDNNNWLGRSQWGADALFHGSYNEFRLYDYALSYEQVIGNFQAGPDAVNTGIVGDTTAVFTGDVNNDGGVNLADAISLLTHLFVTKGLPCLKSADANDDGKLDLADAISILTYQFQGGTLMGPDGSIMTSATVGCHEYDNAEVEDLTCDNPCE